MLNVQWEVYPPWHGEEHMVNCSNHKKIPEVVWLSHRLSNNFSWDCIYTEMVYCYHECCHTCVYDSKDAKSKFPITHLSMQITLCSSHKISHLRLICIFLPMCEMCRHDEGPSCICCCSIMLLFTRHISVL